MSLESLQEELAVLTPLLIKVSAFTNSTLNTPENRHSVANTLFVLENTLQSALVECFDLHGGY